MAEKIEIRKTSIVDLDTDAVVNAANEYLAPGGGVCGAIFKAAGSLDLQRACVDIGHCECGDAVITPGFRLKAKYIIHAVGPRYRDGNRGEPEKLKSAYQKALELAVSNHCQSIGFPLISAGIYGYPVKEAWEVALRTCNDFLKALPEPGLQIFFAVVDEEIEKIGNQILLQITAKEEAPEPI